LSVLGRGAKRGEPLFVLAGERTLDGLRAAGGAKAGWWAKTVQLDLEARGIIKRVKTSPLRLRRA
jgi:hypothetical protein